MTLPQDITQTLAAYSRLMAKLRNCHIGRTLDPNMALILTFIGDRTVYPDEITKTGLFGSNLSYSLSCLEKRGLLSSTQDKVDRRRRSYRATSTGISMVKQINALLAAELV